MDWQTQLGLFSPTTLGCQQFRDREPALQEELPSAQCMKRERLSGWVTDNLKSCLNFKSIYLGNSNIENT